MGFFVSVVLPVLVLLAVAIAAPYLWSRLLPEGVGPLLLNAALSVATCIVAAIAMRFALTDATGLTPVLRWTALTAIVWAPAVVLAIAQQPSRWKEVEW